MSIAMESMAQHDRRVRWERRLAMAAVAFPRVLSHLVAGVVGLAVATGYFMAQPGPTPTVIIHKEIREVEVLRCDASALKQCLRRKL